MYSPVERLKTIDLVKEAHTRMQLIKQEIESQKL